MYRLLAGYCRIRLNDKTYYIKSPTSGMLYEAAEVYREVYNENVYKDWMRVADARRQAIKQGVWPEDGDKKIKDCDDTIENKKIELYETFLTDPEKHKETKAILSNVKKYQSKLLSQKHAFDHMTLEGYAEHCSQCHLFSQIICGSDKERLWASYETTNTGLLHRIMTEYRARAIDPTTLREISRTEPWRSYWSAEKEGAFADGIENDDQRTLVLYSRMYDSVYSHPECPSDDVVSNNDMLDGWLALNKRKAEKDRKTKEVENILPSHIKDGAREVFIPVSQFNNKGERISKEEQNKRAAKIYNLNDTSGRVAINKREAFIKKQGENIVGADMLPDTKIELTHQAKEQFMQRVKG